MSIDETLINEQGTYTLSIPEGGLPTDPKQLGAIYYQATEALGVISKIKAHVKELLEKGGIVDGYDIRPGNKRVEIVDTKKAFQILQEECEDVTADEFLKFCKVSMKELETFFHVKREAGHSIQDSAKDLRELMKPICNEKRGAGVIVQAKPGNRQ